MAAKGHGGSVGFLAGVATGAAISALVTSYVITCQPDEAKKSSSSSSVVPRRVGGAIRLKPEYYNRYTQLHDAVWPEVLQRMEESNIRNFTIYYHRETSTLFSHFEWVGGKGKSPQEDDALFAADMDAIAQDAVVREWWSHTEVCQEPFSQWSLGREGGSESPPLPPSRGGSGDWWAPLLCVCHCGHWPTQFSPERHDPNFAPCNPSNHTTTRAQPGDPYEESRTRVQ